MATTILDYLTQPNVTLICRGTTSTPTYNPNWTSVEYIYEWSDFTYQNVVQRYASELAEKRDFTNPCRQYQDADLNVLYLERSMSDLLAATNMLIVSAMLPKGQFIADSSRTTEMGDISPDWGAGDDSKPLNLLKRTKALLYGDTKYLWSHEDAINLLQSNSGHNYLDVDAKQMASLANPFEQVQHYGIRNKTSIHFIISNKALILVRLHLAPETIQTSPRQLRSSTRPVNQRIPSVTPQTSPIFSGRPRISSLSSSVEAMSIDDTSMSPGKISSSTNDPSVRPQDFWPDIASMHYTVIPWEQARKDGMTVNLAIWAGIRISSENNTLQVEYDPLTPQPTRAIGTPLRTRILPNANQQSEKGKAADRGSPTATTTQTGTANVQYRDVNLFLSSKGTGYNYQMDGKWVINDSKNNWTVIGDKLYNYKVKPYLRADKL